MSDLKNFQKLVNIHRIYHVWESYLTGTITQQCSVPKRKYFGSIYLQKLISCVFETWFFNYEI